MNNILIGYRKMLNINQTNFARLLEISLTTYSKKERGKVEFTQNEMIKITSFLKENIPDVTMDDIFFASQVTKMVIKGVV